MIKLSNARLNWEKFTNMDKIIGYVEKEELLLTLLLAVCLLAIFLWFLYLSEKRKRKKTEELVRGERSFYDAFAGSQKECYLYLNREDLRVRYSSPNLEQMTGLAADRLAADIESAAGLVSVSEKRKIRRELADWDQSEALHIRLIYHRWKENEERHGELQIERTQEGYLVEFRDDTEEFQVLEKLRAELAAARHESRQKTDFLSKMSHEIRTPMNGIIGMLELTRAHMGDRIAAENYLNRMGELSQFLLTLINDILDMSRIESGKMVLEQVPFNIFAMAEKLDLMFRGTVEAKGVQWDIRMQDFDVCYLVGDEMRLSQVVINFISNASKFTPAGGKIEVLFRQMDRIGDELHLMIRVRDTGKGIKKDFIDKIFRPFEQEDASTAHNYGGSGLGMAIADNMIRLMNGQILVESEEGKGSEFTVHVTLPVAADQKEFGDVTAEEELNAEEMEERRKQAVDTFSLKGLRILMAEDNDINAEIAMEILGMEGAVVQRAHNGLEAVQRFAESAENAYDVILMDIQMPEMDGWTAAEEIRRLTRKDADIPIFAMTANAFVEDRRRSHEAGMNGHISKPVDYEEVRRVIGEELYKMRGQKKA